KHVSVLRVRRLLPLADRITTKIILPLVVDSAIFGEATGKRIGVLRLFSGQVFSDWFRHIKRHAVSPPCSCTATSFAGYWRDRKCARQSALGEICMPKGYTRTSAAADVGDATRL